MYLPERLPVCIAGEWHIVGMPLIVRFIASHPLFDDLIAEIGSVVDRKPQHCVCGK